VYARPASAIRAYRDLLAAFVAAGATQIRIVGDLAPVTFGATWDWWARYESAINHAYDDFPLWSMCAYDIRLTPPGVLTDVARTHPRTAALDGRHPRSDTYTDPVAYLSEDRAVPPDPLQATAPALELLAPLPVDARRAVRGLNDGRLDIDRVDDLVVAVSEVVTNALRHGRPPVVLRAWRGADRLVVTVSDGGSGPKDPFAGLLPAGNGSAGGRGLWISHQSCDHVTARRTPEAFTIRLTAGSPHFPV
jgi:anti-sigma regulatory factor (Ser/Thr protein kinase)